MINIWEVNETNEMISNRRILDVRTITLGISLSRLY